jgi:membrane fusion protein (multidrug efflux system)
MADQQDTNLGRPTPRSDVSPAPASHGPVMEQNRGETMPRQDSDTPLDDKASMRGRADGDRRRSWIVRAIFLLIVIAAAVGIAIYYDATKDLVSTDDAFTDGRAVTLAPRVSGYVVALDANDNQFVRKGKVLLRIDPRDYQTARDQAAGQLEIAQAQLDNARAALEKARITFPAELAAAEGNLASARGQLFKAETDYRRQHAMPRAATSQQDVDTSTAVLQQAQGVVRQAEAQVQEATPVPQNIAQAEAQTRQLDGLVVQAKAQLAQAELNLSYTTMTAPQDGWITKRNVEVGDYAQPGASLFSLVTPDIWISANYKEDQLARLRPGQKVTIAVDAYPGLKLRGHVDSIQLGSGSKFTAFPPENATGNFVKIVQRVPVKIVIDSGLDPERPLPLGLSVEPTVDVGTTKEAGN